MAGKKTPDSPSDDQKKTNEASQEAATSREDGAAETESAKADAAESPRDETPETVDAEVVEDGTTFDSEDADTRAADEPPADETPPSDLATDQIAKKGSGIGLGAVLAILLLVGAVIVYFVATDVEGPGDLTGAPGVAIGEAEPFPANELDAGDAPDEGPIEAEAAPGAREAALAADEESEAEAEMRAEAAERAQARREAIEAETADTGSDAADTPEEEAMTAATEPADAEGEDAPQTVSATEPETESETGPAETAMAERLAAARQAQAAEDDEASMAGAPQDEAPEETAEDEAPTDAVPTGEVPTEEAPAEDGAADAEEAVDMAERLAEARAAALAQEAEEAEPAVAEQDAEAEATSEEPLAEEDDPNALSGFLRPRRDPATTLPGQEQAQEQAPATEEAPAEGTMPEDAAQTRPTGQITGEAPAGQETPAPLRRPRGELQDTPRPAETPAPEAQGPETEVPEAQAPEAQAPEAQAPEAQAPEAPASEAADQPQEIAPAPAEADTGPDLDERLQEVRTDVRNEVLAEADQRIEAAIRATEEEVRRLRAELTEQEARSNARIVQLQNRLEVLQSRNAAETQQGVLILALSSLGSEVDQGRPFRRQLDDIQRLAPNMRSLDFARDYAVSGLPTDEALREEFQTAAREAQSAARRDGAEGFEKLWANLVGLFTVRPASPVEGDTPSAVISRAEAALDQGDFAGAVGELRALDGPARDAFEPWMDDAAAKAELRDKIDALERAVLARAG